MYVNILLTHSGINMKKKHKHILNLETLSDYLEHDGENHTYFSEKQRSIAFLLGPWLLSLGLSTFTNSRSTKVLLTVLHPWSTNGTRRANETRVWHSTRWCICLSKPNENTTRSYRKDRLWRHRFRHKEKEAIYTPWGRAFYFPFVLNP